MKKFKNLLVLRVAEGWSFSFWKCLKVVAIEEETKELKIFSVPFGKVVASDVFDFKEARVLISGNKFFGYFVDEFIVSREFLETIFVKKSSMAKFFGGI